VGHQKVRARYVAEDAMRLFPGQDGGQAFRFLGAHSINWPQLLVKHHIVEKE
jgi:hypothetical protein